MKKKLIALAVALAMILAAFSVSAAPFLRDGNDEDPEFEERQEESLREKRRQEQDNKSLDGYLHESDSEYRDE